jgi:hypothetical protein
MIALHCKDEDTAGNSQRQADYVCVLNRFLTFETKEFDVVQKMEDLSMIRTQMRRPSELADWFEIIRDEN